MNSSPYKSLWCLVPALVAALMATPVLAERADRLKKMEVESDQPGKVDLQKQIVTFNGNVVVTKGTLMLRADRIEVRESADGYQVAIATGTPAQPARFRQKREGVDEYIEGEAERLEYESKADTLRLINQAHVRRLRGSEVADEVSGALIVYDNAAEVFTVSGGAKAATPANPTGRVRAVLAPRAGTPAAAEAASAAASRPAPAPAGGQP
ncbi:lipopolysaccharide transport periplasmic protein LptA [Rhizobacter sp. LjRoot28]|uniref:lipopolysaccharide transport periplasmic protein LptA n=1 Tax=Rhizobacter sp. LjRoot28 TaxID=3342309 RepID=UPI003ECE2E93